MRLSKERPQNPRMDRRKGAAIIEFSLVFLLLLFMVAGVFEVGRVIWTYNSLTHAAKQASRYAMVHGSKNPLPQNAKTVATYAKEQAIGVPGVISVSVATTPDNKPGSQVSVTLTHELKTIMGPLVGLGQKITLRGKSVKTIVN